MLVDEFCLRRVFQTQWQHAFTIIKKFMHKQDSLLADLTAEIDLRSKRLINIIIIERFMPGQN